MAQKQQLHIVHLYPKEMNIYGDTGNRLILQKRCQWRGIEVNISMVGIGDAVPSDSDIILGGGGQDAGQSAVQDDLQTKAAALHKLAKDGVVMLMVCGLYQLFGSKFVTHEGETIKGINLLPLETTAGLTRHIGNTLYQTEWGELVGYENHSGLTKLHAEATPFATVLKGAGNNGGDKTEGCRLQNVFGTYSHGPLLSKNPQFADELIRLALQRKYGKGAELSKLDDKVEEQAATYAKQRPR